MKIIRKLIISETEIQHEKLANIYDLFIIKTFCEIVAYHLLILLYLELFISNLTAFKFTLFSCDIVIEAFSFSTKRVIKNLLWLKGR